MKAFKIFSVSKTGEYQSYCYGYKVGFTYDKKGINRPNIGKFFVFKELNDAVCYLMNDAHFDYDNFSQKFVVCEVQCEGLERAIHMGSPYNVENYWLNPRPINSIPYGTYYTDNVKIIRTILETKDGKGL